MIPQASSLQPSAVCLVIDRLPAHLVGAYGNTWIRTPAFDALAVESLLCEFASIDTPDLERLYRGYWRGVHAACLSEWAAAAGDDLPSKLRAGGVRSLLVTDEPLVAGLPLALAFDELVRVDAHATATTAEAVEATQFGRFFAAAAEAVAAADAPALVWLHSQGLAGPWDAPLELRQFYADDEDPEPPTFLEPPNRLLPADHDPDERLGVAQAASGQVTALDACLEMLLAAIDASPRRDDTLFVVLGARGYPLGEHLRLGPCDNALYEELIHVPLMIRLPGHRAPLRTPALAQSADVCATLLDWFGRLSAESASSAEPNPCASRVPLAPPVPFASPNDSLPNPQFFRGASLLPLFTSPQQSIRDRAVGVAQSGQWSIRTPAWYLRHSVQDNDAAGVGECELYVKPDDRFEQNNVTRRCADIVERLSAAGKDFLVAAASQDFVNSRLAPLDEELTEFA